jgi:hypothetical protein
MHKVVTWRHSYTNTHTYRVMQAINMSETSVNDGVNPLLARFFQIFATYDASSNSRNSDGDRIRGNERTSSRHGDADGEMSFRAYMLCACIFRGNMGEAEKLKFWYNVMSSTRDLKSNTGQNDDSEIFVSEPGIIGDHLSGVATGQMVALFLCDAVCGSIGAISAANKAKSVSNVCVRPDM